MKKNFTHFLRMFTGGLVALALCSLLPADILQEIENQFETYRGKYPSTKINLIFNQPIYAPGDTAFFSAWYQDESLLPIKGDHIVTLDLINGNGVSVQKLRFKTKNGRGTNQIVFNSILPPAEYRFVAYTDWMRNFGEAWYYQKNIQLVSKKKIQTKPIKDDITFYVEGGNLVEGLSNNMVVLGPASKVVVIKSHDNAEVAKILLDSTGIGNISMTPQIGNTYSASLSTGKKWPLPVATKDGLTVKMVLQDTVQALLTLPPNSKWVNKELHAIVIAKGKIVAGKKFIIAPNDTYRLPILVREKSEAYHQLYIFDSEKQLLVERIFILRQPETASASLQVAPTANQREGVEFTISVKDHLGYPVESDVTVTVLQKPLFDLNYAYSSFYLADLPDAIERVEKFGMVTNSLNNFLITQKWQRINWRDILGNQTPPPLFPFQSLITLTGQVVSKTTGSAPPDSTAVISYLQKNTIGYEVYTKKGKFSIPIIFDFWGNDQIFVTLQNRSKNIDNDYTIYLDKDSIHLKDKWVSSETSQKSAYGEFAFNKQIISKSYSFFSSKPIEASTNEGVNSILEEEFLGADASINIADYVLFPTMEDLLREVVPFVQFQQKGTRKTIKMSYRYEKSVKIYKEDPLYIIDGLMSKNTSFFLSIKPEDLISLKIINNPNKLAQLGKLGENGIIFVESKKQNLNTVADNNIFGIAGQSRPTVFFNPDYSKTKPSERVPDLRSNYFWAPSLKTDKSGSIRAPFFTGDDLGPMEICVRGLTKDGVPFEARKTINVAFSSQSK